ncbi:SH3 domain-containing protein [Streptomyces noursei]|uniref:SH3 domain-containing protein n=1 Tax=Streptomyces noursei TaxID=1971 RepID=UPI001675BACA|nr:SH3 domain-containing protein [Streptomyces noursei]MCZ1016292.1 SH3 domain-containing protein [Streptomyces noursei]
MHTTPSQPYGTVLSHIGVNERQSPSTDSAIIGSLGHGALVGLRCMAKAEEVEGNRFWFRLRDRDAWIPARYVKGTGHVEWCQEADGGTSSKDEADGVSDEGAGDASGRGSDGVSDKGADATSSKGTDGTSSKGADDASGKGADGTSGKGADGTSSKGADATSSKGTDGTSSKGADDASSKGADGTSGKRPDRTSGKRANRTSGKRAVDRQASDDEWEATY